MAAPDASGAAITSLSTLSPKSAYPLRLSASSGYALAKDLVLRSRNGCATHIRDAAARPTGACGTARPTGCERTARSARTGLARGATRNGAAGTTGTGFATGTTGDHAAGTAGTCLTCRPTGCEGTAGTAGSGVTARSAGDHTTCAAGSGLTCGSAGDGAAGAAGTRGAVDRTRGAVGIPARWRGRGRTGERRERDGRTRSTGKEERGHLRQFHHHEKRVTTD